jgi:Gamma-glutamyl cyclotransferase, AIG2-like
MEPSFVEQLLDHSVTMLPATLADHVRLRPGATYMTFPHRGQVVSGKLLVDLSLADIQRFDRYEGHGNGYYYRTPVKVECNGDLRDAESYMGGFRMEWFYNNWAADRK